MFTSVAGLIKLAWKIGWMLDVFGRLSLKLTGDVCSSISNGPYHFCRNFFVRRCLSHGNVMPSVDSQANFPTRNCSSTMRRRWLACVSIHESTARRRSRSSSSRIHIRSTKLFMFSGASSFWRVATSRSSAVIGCRPLSMKYGLYPIDDFDVLILCCILGHNCDQLFCS